VKEKYKVQLRTIQEQADVIDTEGVFDSIGGIAAPRRDSTGKSLPLWELISSSSSVNGNTFKIIIKGVTEAARIISKDVGYGKTE
jgi:hypothetical protein